MKVYQKLLLVFFVLTSLLITGCFSKTAQVQNSPEKLELRPASDYKFEMRKATKADVIARLGTPDKSETDKDGYETLSYKAPNPASKMFKYEVHSYIFTKKGALTSYSKNSSNE